MKLIIDAHEDIAWNILSFNRDYSQAVSKTRNAEFDTDIPSNNGNTMLGWQEFQQAHVAVVFSTLFAAPLRWKHGEWDILNYRDQNEAHKLYREQLDAYQKLVDENPAKFLIIFNSDDLQNHLDSWQAPSGPHRVGLVILMEGAEGVRSISELEMWWQSGVRIIGPAWAGTRFCGGTREPGPLTDEGRELLDGMADLGFTLDLSHMDELAARQALDQYGGPIISSHSACASLLPDFPANRLLKDDIIKGIIDRKGRIGLIPMLPFLKNGWNKGDSRVGLKLDPLFIAQIDHICQLAGNADHVGIGTDFDGGFGLESAPADLDTIADLVNLEPMLKAKGYSDQDVAAIFGLNWLNHLKESLPS